MLQIKRIIFTYLVLFYAITAFAQSGTYRANNYLFGPQFGYGGSWGSRSDLTGNSYLKLPGASVQFGLSVYRFVSPNQAFGASLFFQQSKWNFSTKQTTAFIQPDAKYSVNEKNLLLPLEFTNYFTPYQTRGFFGIGVVPGYLMQKNLQRMKSNSGDTTTAMVIPETSDLHRFSLGFNAKIGLDGDFDFHHTGRIFLEFNSRFYSSKTIKKSQTFGVFLVVQYMFSN